MHATVSKPGFKHVARIRRLIYKLLQKMFFISRASGVTQTWCWQQTCCLIFVFCYLLYLYNVDVCFASSLYLQRWQKMLLERFVPVRCDWSGKEVTNWEPIPVHCNHSSFIFNELSFLSSGTSKLNECAFGLLTWLLLITLPGHLWWPRLLLRELFKIKCDKLL